MPVRVAPLPDQAHAQAIDPVGPVPVGPDALADAAPADDNNSIDDSTRTPAEILEQLQAAKT